MKKISLFFAFLATIVHCLFFCLESLLWLNPRVMESFKQTTEQAMTTKLLAFNQGFYNLFLALGLIMAIVFLIRKQEVIGKTLLVYTCSCMIGASLVLLYSAPTMITGVCAQGIPPLLAILFCLSSKTK